MLSHKLLQQSLDGSQTLVGAFAAVGNAFVGTFDAVGNAFVGTFAAVGNAFAAVGNAFPEASGHRAQLTR